MRRGFRVLRHGGTLALANKESLVTAGPLLMAEAARHGARILPVDSEHSAVFQALAGEDISSVERIIITASGGALRDWPLDASGAGHGGRGVAPPELGDGAAHHHRLRPRCSTRRWKLIETREFFGVEPAQIEVLVHPESLVHALVGFADGALMAHLGAPDMRHAIGYALNWPTRAALPVARLDLAALGALTFRAPDPLRWPALRLAREVMEMRGLAGAVFNAAKEVALDAFIAGQVGFMDMTGLVEATIDKMVAQQGLGNAASSLDMVLQTDAEARAVARALIGQKKD